MIDGIGTDSPKLVKRNKRDGRDGSANKLESWAQSINRATAATILDSTRQKVRDTFAAFLGPALEARIPFAATYGNHDFQCGILADEQDDIYREFSGCMNPVAGSSPLALEPGTFAAIASMLEILEMLANLAILPEILEMLQENGNR